MTEGLSPLNRSLLATLTAVATLAACVAPGLDQYDSDTAAALEVVVRLDAGELDSAGALYDDYGRWQGADDALFVELYDAARERFDVGDARGAAVVLDLLADRHGDAVSVHEARVYARFVAHAERADADSGESLDGAIADLRALAPLGVGWVDLAEAQRAIDRGELDRAREVLANFLGAWTGQPAELAPYVVDLERYLETH